MYFENRFSKMLKLRNTNNVVENLIVLLKMYKMNQSFYRSGGTRKGFRARRIEL